MTIMPIQIHLVLVDAPFGVPTAIAVDGDGKTICEMEHSDERMLANALENEVIRILGIGVEFNNHINKTPPAYIMQRIKEQRKRQNVKI